MSGGNDLVGDATKAVGLAQKLIEVAGENSDAKEAAKTIAKSAKTVATTIEVCLLPLAAINFGYVKAREYFESKFSEDLSAKLNGIPAEKIIEPMPQIAAPLLQGLGYSSEEVSLKEMYLSLLAKAMNIDTADRAHPSFVEIIRQLTAKEARLFSQVFAMQSVVPFASIGKKAHDGEGQSLLANHLSPIFEKPTDSWNENFPAMVDNFRRLGLLEVSYDEYLTSKNAYDWVDHHPVYLTLKAGNPAEVNLVINKGMARQTDFGKRFIQAAITQEA